jgi:TRAP-type C4-dicarboxylate transport system substrate-binding protein
MGADRLYEGGQFWTPILPARGSILHAGSHTYTGITEYGLHEVTTHVLHHPFYSLHSPILIRSEAWDALPDEVKAEIEELAPEFEAAVEEVNDALLQSEDQRLRDAGMTFIELPETEAQRFYEVVNSAAWGHFVAQSPDSGPAIRELAER